jgi:uncharacterized membrane protein YdjX (TVP38/TMEM64 family)
MSAPSKPAPTLSHTKLLALVALVGIGVVAYFLLSDTLTLENLARQESALRSYRVHHPLLVYGAAFAIYVGVTGLSLPGATVMTLLFGWYFGFVRGLVLVSFASTSGATVAFLLSRYLMRDAVQAKFGDKLKLFNENLEREGAFYLFTLRLIVFVPFFVINVVMGLTPMKTRTFWWVSQLGMLPGTLLYVYAGSTFPTLAALAEKGAKGILTPQLAIAFVALGLFPWLAKKTVGYFKNATPTTVIGPTDNDSPG